MNHQPKIWYNDRHHAVATVGPLIVQHWRGENTYRNWRGESTPVFNHVDATTPKGCCVLILVEESAVTPTAADRREVDELARERKSKVLASAVVSYGSALRTTAVRATAVAINLFSGNQVKPFTDEAQAITWLGDAASKGGVTLDTVSAKALVDQLRKR